MNLALLVPSLDISKLSLNDALNIYALEKSLDHHDLLKIPLDSPITNELSYLIEKQDALIKWDSTSEKHSENDLLWQTFAELKVPCIDVTESPALLLEEKPLHHMSPRFLFCPASTAASPSDTKIQKRWNQNLYQKLNSIFPTLWLASHKDDLESGPEPGSNTLFCPQFPSVPTKAIVSSQAVLSFSIETALIALTHGVPTFFISTNDKSTKLAEDFSIPHMLWTPKLSPDQIILSFETIMKNYPWDTMSIQIKSHQAYLNQILRKHKLIPTQTKNSKVPQKRSTSGKRTKRNQTLRFCSIADEKYLPFFVGLVENLLEVHGNNIEIHFLGVGKNATEKALALFPGLKLFAYTLEDIWNEKELELIQARSISLQAMSSKPKLLHYLAQKIKKPVFFFDLDMYFFRSPIHMLDSFEKSSVLLFPQWSDVYAWCRLHGMFNSGIVGVKPGGENVMDWWAKQCLISISFDTSQGHYGDQSFLELAPIYFDNIKIYKGLDENVAPWNRRTLGIQLSTYRPWKLSVNDEIPVGSFHAAGPDDSGIFEIKHAWDQITSFYSGLDRLNDNEPLYLNTLEQQRVYWKSLNQLMEIRSLLKNRMEAELSPPKPSAILPYVCGWRKPLLWLWNRLYSTYRMFRSPRTPKFDDRDSPHEFWIQLQRETLFPKRHSSESKDSYPFAKTG